MATKRLTRSQVILLLVIVIAIIIGLRWRQNGSENQAIVENGVTPTIKQSNIPTPTLFNQKDYPLWNLLPYSSEKGFVVEKYIAPKTLSVMSKGMSGRLTTELVLEWLKTKGTLGNNHKIVLE